MSDRTSASADSDAPTPREAALREALDELPVVGPIGHGAPDWCSVHGDIPGDMSIVAHINATHDTSYEEWSALDDMREKRTGWSSFDHARDLHVRLQAAASTAAAGEGATGDVDTAWEALREAIRWHRGSLGDADPLIEHRPLIEAALRSRATSETPRETPLAGPLDVERLADALCQAQEAGQHLGAVADTTAAYWRGVAERAAPHLAVAARGSE